MILQGDFHVDHSQYFTILPVYCLSMFSINLTVPHIMNLLKFQFVVGDDWTTGVSRLVVSLTNCKKLHCYQLYYLITYAFMCFCTMIQLQYLYFVGGDDEMNFSNLLAVVVLLFGEGRQAASSSTAAERHDTVAAGWLAGWLVGRFGWFVGSVRSLVVDRRRRCCESGARVRTHYVLRFCWWHACTCACAQNWDAKIAAMLRLRGISVRTQK